MRANPEDLQRLSQEMIAAGRNVQELQAGFGGVQQAVSLDVVGDSSVMTQLETLVTQTNAMVSQVQASLGCLGEKLRLAGTAYSNLQTDVKNAFGEQ